MKISRDTINVLKNFSNINGSIMLKKGNNIVTVSPQRNIFANYSSAEDFPEQIPLYDLNDLISSLNLFETPECSFKKNHMIISDGKQKIKYVYSDEQTVSEAPSIGEDKLANPTSSFSITNETWSQLMKAANVINANVISFKKAGDEFKLISFNNKDPDSNKYEIDLPELDYDGDFDVVLLVENIKMLANDYEISMYDNFVRFQAPAERIEYIIASESESWWG